MKRGGGGGRQQVKKIMKVTKPGPDVILLDVKPPSYRPGRMTNQLIYLRQTITSIFNHKDATEFKQPVNPRESNIPVRNYAME